VWLTVPPLGEAVGPIRLPDYIAHRSQVTQVRPLKLFRDNLPIGAQESTGARYVPALWLRSAFELSSSKGSCKNASSGGFVASQYKAYE